MPAAMKH